MYRVNYVASAVAAMLWAFLTYLTPINGFTAYMAVGLVFASAFAICDFARWCIRYLREEDLI